MSIQFVFFFSRFWNQIANDIRAMLLKHQIHALEVKTSTSFQNIYTYTFIILCEDFPSKTIPPNRAFRMFPTKTPFSHPKKNKTQVLSVDASGRVRRELQPLEALVLVGEPKAEQVARFGDDFFGG